jgi:hypothetical protein
MFLHRTVCLSLTVATNGSVFSATNSQILPNSNVYFSCKLHVVVLLDHHQALCIKTCVIHTLSCVITQLRCVY